MTYQVLLHDQVRERLDNLDEEDSSRLYDALEGLREEPTISRPRVDIERLFNVADAQAYRLRSGSWRCVYYVEDTEVFVVRLVHRSKGYSWIHRVLREEFRNRRRIARSGPAAEGSR